MSGSTNGLEEKRIKGVGEKSNGRERLTDEKNKNKKIPERRKWIFRVRRRGTREYIKEEEGSAPQRPEFTPKPFAIFISFYVLVQTRERERENYMEENQLLALALSRDNKQLVIYLDRRPAQPSTSPTRKKKGEEKLYCNPENEATLLVYDVADSLMTANQQQLSTWIDHRYPIFPLFPFIFFSSSG